MSKQWYHILLYCTVTTVHWCECRGLLDILQNFCLWFAFTLFYSASHHYCHSKVTRSVNHCHYDNEVNYSLFTLPVYIIDHNTSKKKFLFFSFKFSTTLQLLSAFLIILINFYSLYYHVSFSWLIHSASLTIYRSAISVHVLCDFITITSSSNADNNNSNCHKSALSCSHKVIEQFHHKKDVKTFFYSIFSSLFQFKS